jgi:hypothetical protein
MEDLRLSNLASSLFAISSDVTSDNFGDITRTNRGSSRSMHQPLLKSSVANGFALPVGLKSDLSEY